MLEKRLYKFDEIADYLGTRNNQGLRNKLQRYGVKFQEEGRGRMKTFNILSIPDPFPLYCVFDLGIDYRTDFKKLRDFTFFLLRDDDFSGRSGEMMEEYLHNGGYQISRQTIAKYIALYERMDLIATNGETVYYRVYHEGLFQRRYEGGSPPGDRPDLRRERVRRGAGSFRLWQNHTAEHHRRPGSLYLRRSDHPGQKHKGVHGAGLGYLPEPLRGLCIPEL